MTTSDGSSEVRFLLTINETYRNLPKLKIKRLIPHKKKQQEQPLPTGPSVSFRLTVSESWTEIVPKIMVQDSLPEVKTVETEERKSLERQTLISKERLKRSRRWLNQGGSLISSEESIGMLICKICEACLDQNKTWTFTESETWTLPGDRVRVLDYIPGHKKETERMMCAYCATTIDEDNLYLIYVEWRRDLLKRIKKKTHEKNYKHMLPSQKKWQSAYMADMNLPVKERSFLRALEDTLLE